MVWERCSPKPCVRLWVGEACSQTERELTSLIQGQRHHSSISCHKNLNAQFIETLSIKFSLFSWAFVYSVMYQCWDTDSHLTVVFVHLRYLTWNERTDCGRSVDDYETQSVRTLLCMYKGTVYCKAHCSSVCACVWWAQERVCVLTEVPVNVTGGDCQEILKLLLEGVKPVELVEGMVTGAVACGGTVTLTYCSLYGPAIMTGLYVCNNHFDSI